MRIREATPGDLPAIRKLEQQAETAAHWAEDDYRALFAPEAPRRLVLVMQDEPGDCNIAGFLIASCIGDQWEIENVSVATAQRQSGIGSELIRELLRRAGGAGVKAVHLEVRDSNVAARQLYEKFGFTEAYRRRNYYRDPTEDASVMAICITDS